MTEKKEKAIATFKSGNNCAQSVLAPYAEELNFDYKLASQMSSGFGGGMGKLQETCGAVTGSYMVIGIKNSQLITDIDERRKDTIKKVKAFAQEFKNIHHHTDCKSLLNCDLNTEEGMKYLQDNKLDETVCQKCIADSISIIDTLYSE